MSNEFSGTLAKYEVNVGNGQTVTMQGYVDDLDNIVAQMKAYDLILESNKRLIQAIRDIQKEARYTRLVIGADLSDEIFILAEKEVEAALEAARGE